MNRLKRWFHRWNQVLCHNCRSENTKHITRDMIDHIVSEYEIVCANCGTSLNYWAYGNLEFPETKTGRIHMRIGEFRNGIRRRRI